jgi:hypothetical protein
VLLQRAGVAAITIFTEPFREQIDRVTAYQTTDRPLPAISVEHPMQNVNPDEMRKRAVTIADVAQKLLRGEWVS